MDRRRRFTWNGVLHTVVQAASASAVRKVFRVAMPAGRAVASRRAMQAPPLC